MKNLYAVSIFSLIMLTGDLFTRFRYSLRPALLLIGKYVVLLFSH